ALEEAGPGLGRRMSLPQLSAGEKTEAPATRPAPVSSGCHDCGMLAVHIAGERSGTFPRRIPSHILATTLAPSLRPSARSTASEPLPRVRIRTRLQLVPRQFYRRAQYRASVRPYRRLLPGSMFSLVRSIRFGGREAEADVIGDPDAVAIDELGFED